MPGRLAAVRRVAEELDPASVPQMESAIPRCRSAAVLRRGADLGPASRTCRPACRRSPTRSRSSSCPTPWTARSRRNVAKLGAPFHRVYTAQQAQAYKPRLQAFEFMFDSLGCNPEDVLHVSSSLRYDLMSARRPGHRQQGLRQPRPRPGQPGLPLHRDRRHRRPARRGRSLNGSPRLSAMKLESYWTGTARRPSCRARPTACAVRRRDVGGGFTGLSAARALAEARRLGGRPRGGGACRCRGLGAQWRARQQRARGRLCRGWLPRSGWSARAPGTTRSTLGSTRWSASCATRRSTATSRAAASSSWRRVRRTLEALSRSADRAHELTCVGHRRADPCTHHA